MRYLNLTILIVLLSLTAFAQSGGVRGKVISEETEKSLSGVEIAVELEGKKIKTVSSDSKGEFAIQGLADGIYLLTFDKDGFSHSAIRFEVKKGKINDLSNRRLAMPRDRGNMVIIQGAVFDQTGFSVPGAKVEIARLTGGNVWEKIKTIYSSRDGEFIFRFPPSGSATNYRVTVSYKDVEPLVKEKATDSAGIYRLSFNLPVKVGGPKQSDMTKP